MTISPRHVANGELFVCAAVSKLEKHVAPNDTLIGSPHLRLHGLPHFWSQLLRLPSMRSHVHLGFFKECAAVLQDEGEDPWAAQTARWF